MKNFHVLLGSACMLTLSAAALSSCSNDSDPVVAQEDLVEIQMGAKVNAAEVGTRAAAVESWNNTRIGVLGLANGLDWDDASNMLFNGAAVNATVTSAGAVTFTDKYYYPRNSTKTFGYYGYYPTATNITYNVDASEVTVENASFDGNQDVMAGRSEYLADAWNARYARQHSTQKPDIKFNHLTTQFKVLLYQGESSAGYDESLACNQIKSVYFGVPTKYTIKLADGANYNTFEPTISWDNTDSTNAVLVGTGATYPAGVTESTANAVNVNKIVPWQNYDPSRASYKASLDDVYNNLVFVPAGETEYTLYIEFNDLAAPTPVSVKTSTGDPFSIGTSYLVKVKIYGPEEVTATASITPWAVGETVETEIE